MKLACLVIGAFCLCFRTLANAQTNSNPSSNAITRVMVQDAQKLIDLDFSDAKIDLMLPGLKSQREDFEALHRIALSNSVVPAILFNPLPVGFKFEKRKSFFKASKPVNVRLPENREDLAYYSIPELAALIKARRISSEELTRFYLERIRKYGPRLECIITITEDLALQQARRADAEIKAGKYRGLLHGIPYAAKDLLNVKGIATTWGAAPYTNQVFNTDATVIKRLDEAGAVLIAKTTMGELAMGETWFGGMTRNPWNLKDGSSGSSAGSCAGEAAGLFAFAIGTETLGSIVSPCDRCGVTGLRPSYGRVSRAGAMTLSWSMDKIGPICRTVEDCAIVFDAIQGPDGLDQTLYDAPFRYDGRADWRKLRIGWLKSDFEKETGDRRTNNLAAIEKLRALGANLIPVQLPDYPVGNISFLLSTEGAAAFDDLTRSGRDDLLKQQDRGSWPNTFRRRQFVPAVDYLNAQRVRFLLVQEMARLFDKVDVLVAPPFAGKGLLISNLTGHPCVVVPDGFAKAGTPTSICFLGRLFDEGTVLALAKQYQDHTEFHRRHPTIEIISPAK